jgi:hypothetical protein
VATPVRRSYVTELLARAPCPRDAALRDRGRHGRPQRLSAGDGARVASLIGKETDGGGWDRTAAVAFAGAIGDARVPLVLFAQAAAYVEARFGDRQGWLNPSSALRDYLWFFATCAYGLSEVEQEVAAIGDEGTPANTTSPSVVSPARLGRGWCASRPRFEAGRAASSRKTDHNGCSRQSAVLTGQSPTNNRTPHTEHCTQLRPNPSLPAVHLFLTHSTPPSITICFTRVALEDPP